MSNVLQELVEKNNPFKEYDKDFEENSDFLIGYIMELGFEEGVVITNDFFKQKNKGVPKNSFLILRLIDKQLRSDVKNHYILARVTEPTLTPLSKETSKTYFELHKSHMPEVDIFTKAELQWSALKINILGTYYSNDKDEVEFAGDIESYFSPHLYAAYIPSEKLLEKLINTYVKNYEFSIGKLRFTESQLHKNINVEVKVSADDFIGCRTALFGKTRMGKSNTVKIIAESIILSDKKVGQIIFDSNGEYANANEQDGTSLFDKYSSKCSRFSVSAKLNMESLKINMYKDLKLGQEMIKQLMQIDNMKADYLNGFYSFEILSNEEIESLKAEDMGGYVKYLRSESIYKCILKKAGFKAGRIEKVRFDIRKELLEKYLSNDEILNISDNNKYIFIDDAIEYYTKLWQGYIENKEAFSKPKQYFNEEHISLLSILCGKKETGSVVSGARKLSSYTQYHSETSNDVINKIMQDIENGKTVIIDLSNSNPQIAKYFSEKICNMLFFKQMEKFTNNALKDSHVQMYFEEAHNLFPSTDVDLTNIYNRLAKEGAKLNIGIIYSTQSITSLSRDLLKNTENFFIAHLNDTNEIKELTKFYEFKDVGIDVQKTKSKGFVRMITRSHKYALSVQIKLFGE